MYLPFESSEQLLDRLQEFESKSAHFLLFVADRHADELPVLFQAAKQRGISLYGGVFPGLIESARRRDEGVIAMSLPEGAQVVPAGLRDESIDWHSPLPERSQVKGRSALIFLDCRSPNMIRFLEEIYDHYSTSMIYAGAGTGFHDLRDESSLFSANTMIRHGGVVILLPQDGAANVKHGWSRTAGPFIATKVNGNVIQELNWEPAGSFYRNEVEKMSPELRGKPVFPYLNSTYPLSISKQATEDVVRDPIDINDADEIVVLSQLTENSAMYIVKGDQASLIDAARQATEECRTEAEVDFCFVSDCYSRALMLEDDLQQELSGVEQVLQEYTDARAEGVLALGEICGNESSRLSFYNKTFVISLLHRRTSGESE